jgi:radical SAM protein with 4Fe4S-binding SPASM domain
MKLSAPIEVYWWITSRCNLDCVFCLADGGKPYPGGELDASGREAVLGEIIDSRILRVVLTGGEPLMVPGVFGYIRKLAYAGISVELTTNGTLLGEGEAAALKEAGVTKVQLSLNGSSEAVNDPLMGVSHGRIMRALGVLSGLGFDVSVKVTATSWNIADIPCLARVLVERGAGKVKIADPTPMGRAFARRAELTPSLAELESLEERLGPGIQSGGVEFSSFRLELARSGAAMKCSAAGKDNFRAIITPDGAMAPCTMATLWPKKLYVTELGLRGGWERFGEYSEYTGDDMLGGACGVCGSRKPCGGGCRALAYLFTGDIMGEYPLCPKGEGYGAEKEAVAKT